MGFGHIRVSLKIKDREAKANSIGNPGGPFERCEKRIRKSATGFSINSRAFGQFKRKV